MPGKKRGHQNAARLSHASNSLVRSQGRNQVLERPLMRRGGGLSAGEARAPGTAPGSDHRPVGPALLWPWRPPGQRRGGIQGDQTTDRERGLAPRAFSLPGLSPPGTGHLVPLTLLASGALAPAPASHRGLALAKSVCTDPPVWQPLMIPDLRKRLEPVLHLRGQWGHPRASPSCWAPFLSQSIVSRLHALGRRRSTRGTAFPLPFESAGE